MVQSKIISVDGVEYEITQLGATEGHKLWLRLLKTISAVVRGLAGAPTFDERAMARAVSDLITELDEPTYEALCQAFTRRSTLVQGEKRPPLNFDMQFAGNYLAMSKWLGECIMFNFGNFSDGASLGKLIDLAKARVAAAAASKSQSQPTSIGTSGAS